MTPEEIHEKLIPIWDEICATESKYSGSCLSTGLQDDLENAMQRIIPPEIGYSFSFNMSGGAYHRFFEKAHPENFIAI